MTFTNTLVWRAANAAAVATILLALPALKPAMSAVIRNFETSSVPAGSFYNAAAQWSAGGSPGSPAGRLDNTAAPGYGSASGAGSYTGVYRIGGNGTGTGVLTSELGASSLTDFTLVYAYLPSAPMIANGTASDSRQFRLWDFNSGTTFLEVRLAGSAGPRPALFLNGSSSISATQAVNATFSARLMDGDSTTTVNAAPSTGGSGSYSASNPEWVFYAVTYHANSATETFVEEYGMTAGSSGLRKYTSSVTTGLSSTTINLPATSAIDLGSAAFGGSGNRPYDGSFDAFGFYPSVLSLSEIQALATNAFVPAPVPEPSTAFLGATAVAAVCQCISARRRKQS